jgi:hypothetical protein
MLLECILISASLCRAIHSRPIVALGAGQAVALLADGDLTRRNIKQGGMEVDPLARVFIGTHPAWPRMVPMGIVQTAAGMWLAQKMKSSRHAWLRRWWWLPQTAGIAGNAQGFIYSYVHWKRGF